MKEMSLRFKYR